MVFMLRGLLFGKCISNSGTRAKPLGDRNADAMDIVDIHPVGLVVHHPRDKSLRESLAKLLSDFRLGAVWEAFLALVS